MTGIGPARWLGCRQIELEECGSTNDEADALARAGAPHGTVVIARAQRAGRGRDGRVWASPRDAGLYLSAVIRPPLAPAAVPPVTLAIGVGVCDAARALGAPALLKWPNDVLVHGKKLAGVLVEAHSQGDLRENFGFKAAIATSPLAWPRSRRPGKRAWRPGSRCAPGSTGPRSRDRSPGSTMTARCACATGSAGSIACAAVTSR